MTYKSEWWSIELPSQWRGYPDGDCETFRADPALGILQISAACKETGNITEDDLKEFAHARVAPDAPLEKVKFGTFSGFTTRYRKNELAWQEWWLGLNALMVYVTYNVVHGSELAARDTIAGILASLRSASTIK